MDQATLNLMLSSLEGSSEESISDNNSLFNGLELLDNQCEGKCRHQLQLVLERANSIIKLKDSQCKDKDEIIKLMNGQCKDKDEIIKLKDRKCQDKDDLIKVKDSQCKDKDELIKLKDAQCSALKDEIILYLKKSTEMQNTIDLLKTQLKCKESPLDSTQIQNLESQEDQQLHSFIQTNIKEKNNQIYKLQNDLLSEANLIIENYKKQMCTFEKAKLAEAKNENNQLVFGSSNCYSLDSSVAHVKLPGLSPLTAPLENGIEMAGPGWLVMQRRLNGKILFQNNPNSPANAFYKGFGDFNGDFWLGLEKVHQLTTSQRFELFIHLVDFNNEIKYARYDHFIIGGQDEKYKLRLLGDYSGNAGDAMRPHENCYFDNNFWKAAKPGCNLNGKYSYFKEVDPSGIWWDVTVSLKSVQMLIKPK